MYYFIKRFFIALIEKHLLPGIIHPFIYSWIPSLCIWQFFDQVLSYKKIFIIVWCVLGLLIYAVNSIVLARRTIAKKDLAELSKED